MNRRAPLSMSVYYYYYFLLFCVIFYRVFYCLMRQRIYAANAKKLCMFPHNDNKLTRLRHFTKCIVVVRRFCFPHCCPCPTFAAVVIVVIFFTPKRHRVTSRQHRCCSLRLRPLAQVLISVRSAPDQTGPKHEHQ